jgi:hypothetical protein
VDSPWTDTLEDLLATWRSGYAAACKAVYTGSIPVVASLCFFFLACGAGISTARA